MLPSAHVLELEESQNTSPQLIEESGMTVLDINMALGDSENNPTSLNREGLDSNASVVIEVPGAQPLMELTPMTGTVCI